MIRICKKYAVIFLGTAIAASHAQDRFTSSYVPAPAARINDNHMIGTSSAGKPAYRVNEKTIVIPDNLKRDGSVMDINPDNVMVGTVLNANTNKEAFFYYDVQLQTIGTLGGLSSEAQAINVNGTIVGFSENTSNKTMAFIFKDKMTPLGTLPGGTQSWAYDINRFGDVVGESESSHGVQAFFYTNDNMNDLGEFLNAKSSHAKAVNDNGVVTGYFTGPDDAQKSFSYSKLNGMLEIENGLGSGPNRANDINDQGIIVGRAAGGDRDEGFFYVDKIMLNVNDYVHIDGVQLSEVISINNHGEMIASSDSPLLRHFILKPVTAYPYWLPELRSVGPGNAYFASTMSATANWLAAGSREETQGDGYLGAVYVYNLKDGFPKQSQILRFKDHPGFGAAVGLGGGRLAVGADAAGAGIVHIYEQNAGQWEPASTVTPPDMSVTRFGFALAMDGDNLAVAARDAADNSIVRIYLYEHNTMGWQKVFEFTPSANITNYLVLDLDMDRLIVMGYRTTELLIYQKTGGTWALEKSLSSDTLYGDTGSEFLSADLNNGRIAVSNYKWGGNGPGWGQAKLFHLAVDTGWSAELVTSFAFSFFPQKFFQHVKVTDSYVFSAFFTYALGAFEKRDGQWQSVATLVPSSARSQTADFSFPISIEAVNDRIYAVSTLGTQFLDPVIHSIILAEEPQPLQPAPVKLTINSTPVEQVGSKYKYDIEIENQSNTRAATGLLVKHRLPLAADADLLNFPPHCWIENLLFQRVPSRFLFCYVDKITPENKKKTWSIELQPRRASSLSLWAEVNSASLDPMVSDNVVSNTVHIIEGDPSIEIESPLPKCYSQLSTPLLPVIFDVKGLLLSPQGINVSWQLDEGDKQSLSSDNPFALDLQALTPGEHRLTFSLWDALGYPFPPQQPLEKQVIFSKCDASVKILSPYKDIQLTDGAQVMLAMLIQGWLNNPGEYFQVVVNGVPMPQNFDTPKSIAIDKQALIKNKPNSLEVNLFDPAGRKIATDSTTINVFEWAHEP